MKMTNEELYIGITLSLYIIQYNDNKYIHIVLTNRENRICKLMAEEWSKAIQYSILYCKNNNIHALLTSSNNKYWCLGLEGHSVSKQQIDLSIEEEQKANELLFLLAKMIELLNTVPVPTVACITGHAYGGGAILALAHDYHIMNASRGWLCIPAVQLNIILPKYILQYIINKYDSNIIRDMILLGKKYTATDAIDAGLIDSIAVVDDINDVVKEGIYMCIKLFNNQNNNQNSLRSIVGLRNNLFPIMVPSKL